MALTVLTVDDSRTIRDLLRITLESRDHIVVQAVDGVDAMETLEDMQPDMIITDINMPRMDGFGLIERVRVDSRFAGVPILVLSTETTPEKKRRAQAAGATGYIEKPFEPKKLLSVIDRLFA